MTVFLVIPPIVAVAVIALMTANQRLTAIRTEFQTDTVKEANR